MNKILEGLKITTDTRIKRGSLPKTLKKAKKINVQKDKKGLKNNSTGKNFKLEKPSLFQLSKILPLSFNVLIKANSNLSSKKS